MRTLGTPSLDTADAAVAFGLSPAAAARASGYAETKRGAKIATAEKALFDFAYLSSGRSRLFTNLPELELPRGFRRKELSRWLAKIASERSRTLTARKLDELLTKSAPRHPPRKLAYAT